MGEAKRRRIAVQATRTRMREYSDPFTGERRMVEVRVSRDSPRELMGAYLAAGACGSPETAVPCNGCTACCRLYDIDVDPTQEKPESLAHLDLMPGSNGLQRLRRRQDGSCSHLGPSGCTVREHRPRACRAFDCRLYSMAGVVSDCDLSGRPLLTDARLPVWDFERQDPYDRALIATMKIGAFNRLRRTRQGEIIDAHEGLRAALAAASSDLLDAVAKVEELCRNLPLPILAELAQHLTDPCRYPTAQQAGVTVTSPIGDDVTLRS